MANWIIVPVRNNLSLTKKAIASFKKQDIGDVQVLVINNHSTDGTTECLKSQHDICTVHFNPPGSVSQSWNAALGAVFMYVDYALVVNNDVELRPDTYRLLVEDGGGFVTAVGSRDPESIKPNRYMNVSHEEIKKGQMVNHGDLVGPFYSTPNPINKRPHPDFSCYLIRKWVYEKVGPFDEGFKVAFCEDGDYDLRLYKAGIRAYCLDLPYLHHGSQTIKNAEQKEQEFIGYWAARNREDFEQKGVFKMGSREYYEALDKGDPPNVAEL